MKFSRQITVGFAVAALSVAVASSAQAQQPYVGRFDLYGGFADINAPALKLNQPGYHIQAGFNTRRWFTTGFDYSHATGDELLSPDLLIASLKTQVTTATAQLIAAHLLPAGYVLKVPTHAITDTFAFGPQYVNRHYAKTTIFLRPSLGAIRETAIPTPYDDFSAIVVDQLAPAGYKTDWTGFYGVGGGIDYAVTKHFGARMQADAVYNHPFNDLLASGRMTYRFSVGPSVHFGKNIQ